MAKSCKGLAMELVKCLSESDCVKVENKSYRECAGEKTPSISTECVGLRETYFNCKRGQIRQRFNTKRNDIQCRRPRQVKPDWVLAPSVSGSRKIYELEQATSPKGEHLGGVSAICARGNRMNKMLHIPKGNYSYMSRNYFSPVVHRIFLSCQSSMKRNAELEQPLSTYTRFCKKFHSGGLKRRIQGRCECFLSSGTFSATWAQPRRMDKLGIYGTQWQQIEYLKATKTRTNYKAEPYDIEGPNLDSMEFSEVPDVEKTSSWQEKFPKRWVIVLLCFSAFLLCNMDRVNMSIAILPMSAEYNWNPATVGLIQSSFFWGYLLTHSCDFVVQKCNELQLVEFCRPAETYVGYPNLHMAGLAPEGSQFDGNSLLTGFDAMNLQENLLRGIYAYGFEKPSAIQRKGNVPSQGGLM
ncbi:hypothetical protein IFM89_018601 [Coptis chinensis]|uniref:DEAD-box RNA helicase Q domain-containing protein n=2 Tax=Mesangiospermae TaxID=1437183 RepID=A0A835M0I0_9MAGN|nr:hypothetical protein IFM89_018601 [Coptis chinensis]